MLLIAVSPAGLIWEMWDNIFREIFPGTTPMAPGGATLGRRTSESAALVMPSVVAAARAAAELLAVIPAAPRGAGDRRGEPLPSGL